ncbi:MAG TPA: MarR family transcriptional regulator [Clostridiales bacterium UBA8960]|nr:MarR family transcriptional regulator [Clostridiales bacterium UBA8960]
MENILFDLIDQVKVIISEDIWENILMNCTKNELFVLMLLYRKSDVNMTQIAEYIGAPLNTTTGIVGRMEKKDMIRRVRSESDKRVVTIVLTEFGRKQVGDIFGMFLQYGQIVISTLSAEELTLLSGVIGKVVAILQNNKPLSVATEKKIRKIEIE